MRCVQFAGQGAIAQKPNDVCNKCSVWPSSTLKKSRSGVSFVAPGCLGGQILVQKFTQFDCVCITARTSSHCEECV